MNKQAPEDKPIWQAGDKPLIRWSDVCRLFERKDLAVRHPRWRPVLEKAAIFDFTGVDSETLRTGGDADIEEALETPLPFPQVVILLGWSVLAVEDMWFDQQREIVGAEFLAIGVPYPEHKGVYANVASGRVEYDGNASHTTFSDGSYTDVLNGKPRFVEDDDSMRPYRDGEQSIAPDRIESLLQGYFWTLLGALTYLNQPTHFIVRETPKKMGKTKQGQIPRAYARPRYIVVDKDGIQTRYHNSQSSERRSPMPHLRRGHYRTLASNRYKEPGKRVWVRATHVKGNDVEWREGDRMYKVI